MREDRGCWFPSVPEMYGGIFAFQKGSGCEGVTVQRDIETEKSDAVGRTH